MTLAEACREAAKRFRAAGVPDPAWDSGVLMECVTGVQPLLARLSDRALTEAEGAAFASLCARRETREPLQYILGEQSFYNHVFRVDSRALIPRPETEQMTEYAAQLLQACEKPAPAVLDLCCGSGCIGISLSLACPSARVACTDMSPEALALAAENAGRLGARVVFCRGDLWDAVGEARYDFIVSNPPYISDGDFAALQAEVRQEPALALRGGADGLIFYRRIAAEAEKHLFPGGCLLLEVGEGQAEAVASLLRPYMRRVTCRMDYRDVLRVVEAWR